jgi:glycosyltransferase involved in cell wall biosynthesis
MSGRPWLSVLMPLHEGERHLPATLKSIAAQDLSGIEILAFDSSPTDNCRALVEAWSPRLPVVYRHLPQMKSWTAKTNLAADAASAAHLCMLHQDDLWLPGRVADVRKAIAAHPDAVLLLNPSTIIDREGRQLGLWRCPLPADRELAGADLAPRLLVQNFVAIPAPVIRRDAWLAAGGLDEALWYTADWDLYLKLARHGTTVYRRTVSTAFRVHGGSLTVTGSANQQDFARQLNTVIDRHIDLAPAPRRRQVRRRALASSAVNCALARAMGGNLRSLPGALLSLAALGPSGVFHYLRNSRILERALPRLRARLAGAF